MYYQCDFSPAVLEPADIATAQDAGARFARQMAGATKREFHLNLADQLQVIRSEVADVGFSRTDAEMAVSYFRTGAELEWQRIASRAGGQPWGNA